MVQRIFTYTYIKILFALVYTFVLSNKLHANTIILHTNLNILSAEDRLQDEDDVEFISVIDLEEKTEEDFVNDFSIISRDINITGGNFVCEQGSSTYLHSFQKVRYYILYCRLKLHS